MAFIGVILIPKTRRSINSCSTHYKCCHSFPVLCAEFACPLLTSRFLSVFSGSRLGDAHPLRLKPLVSFWLKNKKKDVDGHALKTVVTPQWLRQPFIIRSMVSRGSCVRSEKCPQVTSRDKITQKSAASVLFQRQLSGHRR